MGAGALDTRIRFEQRTKTQDPRLGTYIYTWAEVATVWADVQDMVPSRAERIADGIAIQMRPTRVRIRYRTDITSDMRVIIGSDTYRIVGGTAELGRRDRLEMVCEVLTTEGVAP